MAASKSPGSDIRMSEPTENATKPEDTAVETTEKATDEDGATSTVTDEEYDGMLTVLNNIYAFRTKDGDDPSKLFHRKVNKRALPDYYDVIKEPMAMSTIKAKVNGREYKSFEEFVRDWALICHNAQVYNSPNAQAYQDALIIKEEVEKELAKLVAKGGINKDRTEMPFLGEIPPVDEAALAEVEEEEDDDEDDEDASDDDSDEEGKKKRKRGRPSLASKQRDSRDGKDRDDDPESRKKRGRPPRVDTPMESRIKAVIKGLRKPKNSSGELMIGHFERLPDKALVPEYFNEIKQPIAMDVIKKKLKRKKYNSVDQFMRDVELMFENAKHYNEDGSVIYRDALALQKEARVIAEQEKKKPDTEFMMEDGRIPLPDGILHNGELWKVGDWVHIQNANDLSKPIVAQIYRTYEDQDGGKWVNACWYYRPEQTVHRFDKHFFENEVVKTGQYRDHRIDEVVDRCFVMFITRYNKGRPRGFPADKEVYVCEARYNEEKHKINKIKTWASCLPDEVRDKDYEMDLFDAPKKLKKVQSPIKYLFKEDEQKETDDLPKPIWGAPNAPPKIGAVHCRPRDPKESPPPEPTPTPPPQPPPQPTRQHPVHQANGFPERTTNINIAAAASTHPPMPQQGTSSSLNTPMYHPNHHQYHQNISPAPTPQPIQMRPTGFSAPQVGYGHHPHQQHHPPAPAPMSHYSPMAPTTPAAHHLPPQRAHTGPTAPPNAQTGVYKAPNPNQVFYLPDAANAAIPAEIRAQFQTDAQGRILFFTAPPVADSEEEERKRLAHTPRYLAWKARQMREKLLKRKLEQDGPASAGSKKDEDAALNGVDEQHSSYLQKKQRVDHADGTNDSLSAEEMLEKFSDEMCDLAMESWKSLYRDSADNDLWKEEMFENLQKLSVAWEDHAASEEKAAAENREREREIKKLAGLTNLMDYKPPNEHLEWGRRR